MTELATEPPTWQIDGHPVEPIYGGCAPRTGDNEMYFEIHRSGTTGMYWWRIVATNGRILAHSEQYTAKQSCLHAIGVVQRGAATAMVYDRT